MPPPPSSRRRSAKTGIRILWPVFFLVLYLGILGLGMVWSRQQLALVAEERRVLEVRIRESERQLADLDEQMAVSTLPAFLLRQNERFRLGLVPPSRQQVVDVTEDPRQQLRAMQNRQLYSRSQASTDPLSGGMP